MDDDASRNPEADSFGYVHMIIEALNKLGHLDAAVNKMEWMREKLACRASIGLGYRATSDRRDREVLR